MHSSDVDIMVVGGGPAGLMAASYLSKHHHVALIERGLLGQTRKCWVTTRRRLQRHDLQDCIVSSPDLMTAGTFLGAQIAAHGDYAVVDDHKLLQKLAGRCRIANVQLYERCRLLSLSWTVDRVRIETTGGPFLARLVVDATGGLSPVASTFRLHRIDGFYAVYGAMLRRIELRTSEIVLGYVSQLGNPPRVLEVFPTGRDSAYCVVFVYSKILVPPQSLAAIFDDHCLHNPFFKMSDESTKEEEKAGAIPIGRRHRRNLPGIVSFGEAGLIQPPLMGTAFNEVLEHAELLCNQITSSLNEAGETLPSPKLVYPLRKRFQDRIQLPLVRAILSGNIERFDSILRAMRHFPDRTLFNFFSNELTWWEAASLAVRLPWHLAMEPAATKSARARVSQKIRPR